MKPSSSVFNNLKDWWWLYSVVGGVLCSAILIWGSLPARIAKAESKVEKIEEQNHEQYRILDRLTYVAEQNQQIQTRQMAEPPPVPWIFLKQDGDWQVFRDPDGKTQCCNGTTCHPKPKKGSCGS